MFRFDMTSEMNPKFQHSKFEINGGLPKISVKRGYFVIGSSVPYPPVRPSSDDVIYEQPLIKQKYPFSPLFHFKTYSQQVLSQSKYFLQWIVASYPAKWFPPSPMSIILSKNDLFLNILPSIKRERSLTNHALNCLSILTKTLSCHPPSLQEP